MRVWLIALLCAAFAAEAAAQTVFNPNSPRARRDFGAAPPTPPAQPGGLGETVTPDRWGTHSSQVGKPQWGTYGHPGPTPGQPKFR